MDVVGCEHPGIKVLPPAIYLSEEGGKIKLEPVVSH
jgi:hypothetical protein